LRWRYLPVISLANWPGGISTGTVAAAAIRQSEQLVSLGVTPPPLDQGVVEHRLVVVLVTAWPQGGVRAVVRTGAFSVLALSAPVLWMMRNKAHLTRDVCHLIERDGIRVLVCAIVDQKQTERLVRRVLDPDEFLSPYGLRSLSRHHAQHPFRFGQKTVEYEPAEAESKIKGGNSNWRGPVWFPTSFLMIEALRKLGRAYGDTLTIPEDGRDGPPITYWRAAESLANRMISIFTRGADGRRPMYGGIEKFQQDPHWKDLILFHEYFHGDTGFGLGASHQTGWTGLVASLIDEWRRPPQASSR
jgi:hypothetical protein